MTLVYRIVYSIAWTIFKIIFPFKIIGRENIPKDKNFILYANHIALTDPVLLAFAMGHKKQVHFMGKEELFIKHKILGGFLKSLGGFAIKRSGGVEGINTAIDLYNEGKIIGIFPEGTRSKDGNLGRAKSGISLIMSLTGANALPCTIKCKNQKVRLFRKITVEIFPMINSSELILEDAQNLRELKKVTEKIMKPIVTSFANNNSEE